MNHSESIADLMTALAKAQSELTFAAKDSTNPAFSSKYADLASVISAVRPVLSKHGIAFIQFDGSDIEKQTASVTTSLHFKDQWISASAEAPAIGRNGFNVQALGAAWTYLRRYQLQALCGLASDDDDGNSLAQAPVGLDKDVKEAHLGLMDVAQTVRELEVFYTNAVRDARKSGDKLAEREFVATKNATKAALENMAVAK